MKTVTIRFILSFILFLVISLAGVAQEVKVKEVSVELPGGNIATVDIDMQRDSHVEIVPWEQTTIKIVYQYYPAWYGDLSGITLSDMGFEAKQSGSKQIISVGSMPLQYAKVNLSSHSDYIVIDGKKYNRTNQEKTEVLVQAPAKEKVIFYIPRNAKLILKLYYNASITLAGDLVEADITTSFGGATLKGKSIKKLFLKTYYPRASFDTIGEATVDITGGQLFIREINKLIARSSYAAVQIESADEIDLLSSQSDEYIIEELGNLFGSQKFGVCRINVLRKGINMEESADIVIKNILPEVTTLKIKSARVNLNLPVINLKNYSIDINGAGSTLLLTEEIRKGAVPVPDSATKEHVFVKFGDPGSVRFTSNVGNIKGAHTFIDIHCPSCHISFR